MMDFLRRHKITIFVITLVGFLGGTIIGFGGYLFGPQALLKNVAEVNGKKIPYDRYRYYFNQMIDNFRESETEITSEIIEQCKQQAMQQLIQQEILIQEAKKLGIEVSNNELAMYLHSIPAFQYEGRFNQGLYFQTLFQELKLTPEEFEEEQRRNILSNKLRKFVVSNITINKQDIDKAYAEEYKPKQKELSKEINEMNISDEELQESYKKKHDGNLDKFEKEKKAFLKEYKKDKHKNEFANLYREKRFNQIFNDWAQKVMMEVKVKSNLEQIEKLMKESSQ